MLILAVTGEVEIHPGVGIAEAVLTEDGLQFVAGHLLRVSSVGTEDAQQDCALAVFLRRDLFEVIERPVHLIAVHMVYLHAGRTRTDESLVDEMVAETVSELTHASICRSAFMRIRRSRISARFEFASFGGIELAVGAGEESFAADRFRWHLFDNRSPTQPPHEREERSSCWLIGIFHNASDSLLESANVAAHWEIRCKGKKKKKESRISGLVRDFRDYFGIFGTKSGLNRD